MLKMRANLIHKPCPDQMFPSECQIEKVIELPETAFAALITHPFSDRDYIADHVDLMGTWDGDRHCLLILDGGGNDGVLIDAQGYRYARYAAYISHARDLVESELRQIADMFLKDISPDEETGSIDIYLDDLEEYTGAEVRDDSDIARIFFRILQDHPAVAVAEAVGDCISVTPVPKKTQEPSGALKLRDLLLLNLPKTSYMVHDTIDVGFIFAPPLAGMSAKDRETFAELLNAAVKEIRPGAYGPEIVLTNVDAELLVEFDRAAVVFDHDDPLMEPTL